MTKVRKTPKPAKPHCRKLKSSKSLGYCIMHDGEPHFSFDKQSRSMKSTKKTFVNAKNVRKSIGYHYH